MYYIVLYSQKIMYYVCTIFFFKSINVHTIFLENQSGHTVKISRWIYTQIYSDTKSSVFFLCDSFTVNIVLYLIILLLLRQIPRYPTRYLDIQLDIYLDIIYRYLYIILLCGSFAVSCFMPYYFIPTQRYIYIYI